MGGHGGTHEWARVGKSGRRGQVPAWIELPFDRCHDEAEYRRVLGAPIRLAQPRTAVVLERRLLTEGTRVEVKVAGERVRVAQQVLDPAGAGSRQVAGLGAASLVRVARLLAGTMLAPASGAGFFSPETLATLFDRRPVDGDDAEFDHADPVVARAPVFGAWAEAHAQQVPFDRSRNRHGQRR